MVLFNGLGEQYLNNSESSEYVLYYGKGSQRKNDSLNYIDSDKNDLYAKVVKWRHKNIARVVEMYYDNKDTRL